MHASIDGRRIAYDDSGGHSIPLVLLHGFPLDRTIWDEQVSALRDTRVIRVDLRGCGESEPSDGPALMEALAGDVAGVLDALQVERATVVGHSIGGYVALAFFRMYEERVAGFGLIASHTAADASRQLAPGAPASQRELAAGRDALADRLEREGTMAAAVESYLPRYFAPQVYGERPDLVERARAVMVRQNPRGCAQLVRGMKERVAGDDLLADIRVPALIVAGADDVYIAPHTLRATAAAIAGARLEVFEGVGHAPMLEAPQRTADALADLAQRVR
ncbi:MAG: alpha/beta fold hydrolase [Candidatus Elarobacter sp.]